MSSTLRHVSYTGKIPSPYTIGDTKISTLLSDHDGWLKCDGRDLNKNEFSHLFAVIGYTFGGSGLLFSLPDGRGRVAGAIGSDGNGISGDEVWTQGTTTGTQYKSIDISNMPSHTHDISTSLTGISINTGTTGITINASGSHTHTVNNTVQYGVNTRVNVDNGPANELNLDSSTTTETSSSGNHTHSITDTGHTHTVTDPEHTHTASNTGGDVPINIMQPTIFIGNMFIYGGRPQFGSRLLQPSHRVLYY